MLSVINLMETILLDPTHPVRDRLLVIGDVEHFTSLSRSTIYRQVKTGDFPRPRRIARRNLWSAFDLNEWLLAHRSMKEAN